MKNILIVIILGFITGFVITKTTTQSSRNNIPNTEPTLQVNPQESYKPPILPSNKAVKSFGYNYTLGGMVKEFIEQGSDYKLTLQKTDEVIPSFVTNKNTIVVRKIDGTDQEADFSDVKPGQNVLLGVFYDFKNKAWRLSRIIIIQSAASPAMSR